MLEPRCQHRAHHGCALTGQIEHRQIQRKPQETPCFLRFSLFLHFSGDRACIKDYVFIDPPYNTGNEGWVYNDNVNDPKIKKWLGEVVGKEGEDLTRHDKWLCMMYPRLKLLADDGVIFISIDDIEVTYLRLIMDEIFGKTNFIAQLIWKSRQNKDTATSASTRSPVC